MPVSDITCFSASPRTGEDCARIEHGAVRTPPYADYEDPKSVIQNLAERRLNVTILLFALLTSGCFSFSSFQSAKIVDPGKSTSTISVARNNFLEQNDHDPGWTLLDIRNRVGLGSGFDAAFKVSAARRDENGGVGFLIGGDIRAALWKDHLTVAVPVQVSPGDFDFYSFQLYPGLIGTWPVSDRIEVNASGNVYVFVKENDLSIYTYGLGLGVRPTNGPLRLRPEIGWLRFGDTDKVYRQIGLAVEFPIRRNP